MSPTRLVAILGGLDWSDASAEHLVVPVGVDLASELAKYNQWVRDVYRVGDGYLTFSDWLRLWCGARPAGDTDVEVFEEYDS